MDLKTADLSDEFDGHVQVAESVFRDYGGVKAFSGEIVTLRVFEDNSLVALEVETDGHGRVLVVDGGGSVRRSLVGDRLAQLACDNGWAGLVVNGAIRDSADIAGMPIGVKALNTIPRKTDKQGVGDREVTVHFAGVTFEPGHYVYADEDGILVSPYDLFAQNR